MRKFSQLAAPAPACKTKKEFPLIYSWKAEGLLNELLGG